MYFVHNAYKTHFQAHSTEISGKSLKPDCGMYMHDVQYHAQKHIAKRMHNLYAEVSTNIERTWAS